MKVAGWVIIAGCYVAIVLGWKRLRDAVAPRDLDVRHPSDVWDGIDDVDSLDGGS